MDLDSICYKEVPIKRVIIRLDFLYPREELNESLPHQILKVIQGSFPLTEPMDLFAKHLQLQGNSITSSESKSKAWNFHTTERNATLTIEESSMAIVLHHYISFVEVFRVFKEIKDIFFSTFRDLICRRVGIRYINEIEVKDDGDVFDWSKYINPNLLSIFSVAGERKSIIRAFHNLEILKDDIRLKFQYGMHNPDYPAHIKKKIFILDLDASRSSIIEEPEIDDSIRKAHKIIQEQFEKSITDEYRLLLRIQN